MNANQIMLSKTLAGLLWMCIDVVVVSLCAVLASLGAYGFVEGALDSTVPYWMLSAAGGDLFGAKDGVRCSWHGPTPRAARVRAPAGVFVVHAGGAHGRAAQGRGRHRHLRASGLDPGLAGGIGAIVASSATIYWGSVTFDYDVFTFFMSAASWVLLLGGAAICYALCVHLLKRRIELT